MFVRIKLVHKKGGRMLPYAYLCESEWSGGKAKQKILAYLGRLDLGVWNRHDVVFDECKQCGVKENLVTDHVVPLFAGGFNTLDNVQVLCKKCNVLKHYEDKKKYEMHGMFHDLIELYKTKTKNAQEDG